MQNMSLIDGTLVVDISPTIFVNVGTRTDDTAAVNFRKGRSNTTWISRIDILNQSTKTRKLNEITFQISYRCFPQESTYS